MKGPKIFLKLFSNIFYKIIALCLATLIWYVVQGEEILEVNAKLDVKVEVPSGFAIRDSNSISRDITLRGPRALVGALQGKALQAIVRVPSGKTGSLRYRLDKEFIPRWDNRVRLTIHDPYVTLAVEDLVIKKVPVKASLQGDIDPASMIESMNVTPTEIEISGPKSELSRISELTTEPIDVSKLNSSKTYVADVFRANFLDVSMPITSVSVSVNIGPKKATKQITTIPLEILDSDKVGSTRPATVSITVAAPDDLIANISQKEVRATVSAKDLGPGRYDVDVQVSVPEGFTVQDINPKSVSVEIYNQKKLK